jgi:hypothetical protein
MSAVFAAPLVLRDVEGAEGAAPGVPRPTTQRGADLGQVEDHFNWQAAELVGARLVVDGGEDAKALPARAVILRAKQSLRGRIGGPLSSEVFLESVDDFTRACLRYGGGYAAAKTSRVRAW